MRSNTHNKGLKIWTVAYTIIVMLFSIMNFHFSFTLFILYFMFSLPFVYHVEYYIAIVMMFSTIPYYFVGAAIDLFSMPTILFLLLILNRILNRDFIIHIDHQSIVPMIGVIFIATVSYNLSSFHYLNGWIGLLLCIFISLIIALTRLEVCDLFEALLCVALTMVFGYILCLAVSGNFVNNRLTISDAVNTNSFGKSCAQIATILSITILIYKEKRVRNVIFCLVISLFSFLTGSRGSLMAFIASALFVSFVFLKRQKQLSKAISIIFSVTIVGFIGVSIVSSIYELDLTRFSMESLSDSRRFLIYDALFPYIIEDKKLFWFGYGPGHDCSRKIIQMLITWDFTHTHNTFFEAFGELGIGGFVLTVYCTISSFLSTLLKTRDIQECYVLLGLIICLIINSFSESFFCGFLFWCLLVLCKHDYCNDKYSN